MPPRRKRAPAEPQAEAYRHPESESLMRPEVGVQPQFKKKKPPRTYRYDSSLSPALDWDGQNAAREQAEQLLRIIHDELSRSRLPDGNSEPQGPARQAGPTALDAVRELIALSKPFLNWAGKAERLSFDVPTLPLFIHERLSTQAIIETLIANNEPPAEEVLVDRPEVQSGITRVSGPFEVEASIPTAMDVDEPSWERKRPDSAVDHPVVDPVA